MDYKLSEHFSFFELTVTNAPGLQKANRVLMPDHEGRPEILALHCEEIRRLCGDLPMIIHSGYRAPAVNDATAGSSSTSQHPKWEAVDFHIENQRVEDSFNHLLTAGRGGLFRFGQLILEEAERGHIVRWVHCSVVGTLNPSKVGEILKMKAGIDWRPHYTKIDQIKFGGI